MKHNPNSETDFLQVLVKTRAWDNECAILVSGVSALLLPGLSRLTGSGLQFCNIGAPASWSSGDPMGNEEGRIGCSQVCVPFKGSIGAAVRFLFFRFPLSPFMTLSDVPFLTLLASFARPLNRKVRRKSSSSSTWTSPSSRCAPFRPLSAQRSRSNSSPAALRTLARYTECEET